jgi:hypothetical protein
MSTLQIGLAVAGGVVLAAVVAHEAWKARKMARASRPRGTLRCRHAPQQGEVEPSWSRPLRQPEAFPRPLPRRRPAWTA